MGFGNLSERYRIFQFDAAYKGYYRAFIETFAELAKKKTLKRMGIVHPDLSVNLTDTIARSQHKDAHENQPSSFYTLNKGFSKLNIPYKDIQLLDIGSGTGRVLTFGMLLKVKHVTGIDLDEEGIRQAISNCSIMQQRGYKSGFDVFSADACTFEIPVGVNVIYLFNPFGEKTMNEVIGNIVRHVDKTGKPVFVIYANPTLRHLFDNYPQATKIFESFFKNKKPDMAIFRIERR